MKLKLWQLEELSQLIYKRNNSDLLKWLRNHDITDYEISTIQGNDRVIIMFKDTKIYVAISGSDDRGDLRENFMIKKCKRLFNIYEGVAFPAEEILLMMQRFCAKRSLSMNKTSKTITGHSRGDNIAEALIGMLNNQYFKTFTRGFGFGGTGAGGRKFWKRCKCRNYTRFRIKGDFSLWVNPFNKCIGKVIKLPKQIKGPKRFFLLFKGKMNHREYGCIKNIEPYCNW